MSEHEFIIPAVLGALRPAIQLPDEAVGHRY